MALSKWGISAIVLVSIPVAILAIGAMIGSTPAGREKAGDRNAIELCWQEQGRKSNSAPTAQFVAGACEMLESKFAAKYGHRP
jgi:hypothetical protein